MPLGAIQKLHGRKYSGKDAINIEITGVIGAAMRKCRGSYGGVSGQLWGSIGAAKYRGSYGAKIK